MEQHYLILEEATNCSVEEFFTLNLRLYHRYDLRHRLLPEMCLDSYFPTQKNLKSYSKNEILYFMINYST